MIHKNADSFGESSDLTQTVTTNPDFKRFDSNNGVFKDSIQIVITNLTYFQRIQVSFMNQTNPHESLVL